VSSQQAGGQQASSGKGPGNGSAPPATRPAEPDAIKGYKPTIQNPVPWTQVQRPAGTSPGGPKK
jgi:hypothetical protein